MPPDNRSVSWLRVAREQHRLTMRELSHLSGIAPGAICRIETGRTRKPNLSTRTMLANALGYEVEELFPPSGRTRNRELREWAKVVYGKAAVR